MQLVIDPRDPEDRITTRAILDLMDELEAVTSGPALPLDTIIERLINRDTYGVGRLGYAALVAANCPTPTPAGDVLEHFKNAGSDGRDPNKAIGGTHRALEKSWKRLGGTAYSPMFITTGPDGSHEMDPTVAEAVRRYMLTDLNLASISDATDE